MPRARSSSSSWGLIPVCQRLVQDVARVHPCRRVVAEAEAELSLAQSDELLQRQLDAGAEELVPLVRGQGAHARVERRAVPREGRHHEAVPEDDGSLARRGADREVARLLAEGHDLQDVEERQVLEIAREAHRGLGRKFYTAARISSGHALEGHRAVARRPPPARPSASRRSRSSPRSRPGCGPRRRGSRAAPPRRPSPCR